MSTTTELAELHELVAKLQRCAGSLKTKYGNTPAMRRILNDVERLDIDACELDQAWTGHSALHAEKIQVPDTQYDNDFWRDVDDEGLGGTR